MLQRLGLLQARRAYGPGNRRASKPVFLCRGQRVVVILAGELTSPFALRTYAMPLTNQKSQARNEVVHTAYAREADTQLFDRHGGGGCRWLLQCCGRCGKPLLPHSATCGACVGWSDSWTATPMWLSSSLRVTVVRRSGGRKTLSRAFAPVLFRLFICTEQLRSLATIIFGVVFCQAEICRLRCTHLTLSWPLMADDLQYVLRMLGLRWGAASFLWVRAARFQGRAARCIWGLPHSL